MSEHMDETLGLNRLTVGLIGASAEPRTAEVRGTVEYDPQFVLDSQAALTMLGRSVTVSPGRGPPPEGI